MSRIVGTQWVNVTPSALISLSNNVRRHSVRGRPACAPTAVRHRACPTRGHETSASSACRRFRRGSGPGSAPCRTRRARKGCAAPSAGGCNTTPLGSAGRAAGVEGRRLGVLVEVGKVVVGRRRRQHVLVDDRQTRVALADREEASLSDISTTVLTLSGEADRGQELAEVVVDEQRRRARVARSCKQICSCDRRTFTVCRIAPIIGTAKNASRNRWRVPVHDADRVARAHAELAPVRSPAGRCAPATSR